MRKVAAAAAALVAAAAWLLWLRIWRPRTWLHRDRGPLGFLRWLRRWLR